MTGHCARHGRLRPGRVGDRQRLAADGRRVVVADLDTPANRKKARALPGGVEVRWADLTDPRPGRSPRRRGRARGDHPPRRDHPAAIYRNPKLARRVNVDATATLVRVAEAQPNPPRFVQASSNAVFGARNPHRVTDAASRRRPDAALRLVQRHQGRGRADRAVLEPGVGGAATRRCAQPPICQRCRSAPTPSSSRARCPTDGRMHTVDVRDVACGVRGGDDGRRRARDPADRRRRLAPAAARAMSAPALAAALGHAGCAARGAARRPRQRRRLVRHRLDGHQPRAGSAAVPASFVAGHARRDARRLGWKRYPAAAVAPLARAFLKRRAAYWKAPGKYADPWGAIRAKLGEPAPDKPYDRP